MKLSTLSDIRDHSLETSSGCWEWAHSVWGSGYGRIVDDGRPLRAHRVAYEIANGSIPADLLVLHSCDNRRCVNPAHLRLGTHAENMRDRATRNRTAVGERCHRAKLLEEHVREIKSLHAAGAAISDLAREYGVAYQSIWRIVRGRGWRHV